MKKYWLFIFFLVAGVAFHLHKLFIMKKEIVFAADEFIFYIMLIPVLEEVVFRGGVQSYLKNKIRNFGVVDNIILSTTSFISIQNIVTSLIFSMAHLLYFSPSHAVLVFFPSIIFGLVYEQYNKLLFPIILHGIYNLNVFII